MSDIQEFASPISQPTARSDLLNWRLRPARPIDAAGLRQSCLPHQALEQVDDLLKRAQKAARNRRGLSLVAELTDGTLIGFGQLTLWSRVAEISDVIVGERWRGQGVGSAIIRRLLDAAREMAVSRAEIGVALRNVRALQLYRRLGFQTGHTIELDLGDGPEPVLVMEMDLTAAPPPDAPEPHPA